MIIDCVAELHGFLPKLPGGDLLIVAGDLTASDTGNLADEDTFDGWEKFYIWLRKCNYRKIIYIAGNRDNCLIETTPTAQRRRWQNPKYKKENFEYLRDSGSQFEGLKIWGSPWTVKFDGQNSQAMTFTCDTDEQLAEKWAMIPDDTDILVTHCPPYGMFDKLTTEHDRYDLVMRKNCGSRSLFQWTSKHPNSLKLHVFGHIHEQGGKVYDVRNLQQRIGDDPTTVFVNASYVDEDYHPRKQGYVRIEL